MSVMIAPDLWQQLCAILQAHPTCQVILHQHQGTVVQVEHRRNREEQIACYPSRLTDEPSKVLTRKSVRK